MRKHADAVNKYIEENFSSDEIKIQNFSMLHCGKRIILDDQSEKFIYFCPVDNKVKISVFFTCPKNHSS
ncbi:hypothetical protein V1503_07965 [Bacillus sp. SCS-151]|uniref:hypothetical protein n=1 Tax=Nanhaiella sioensis TaxID=3115293 RepID=UPI00397B8794